jgi:antitoxin component YwqK of YwqJK toxin-antitoxin module
LILFNQDTINQTQNTGNEIKYGRWVFFRKNGYVKHEGYYEWGMKQGYWKYYSRKNQLKKIVKFKNDKVLEIHKRKGNYHKFFEYKKASENWDFGESRYLEKGNCQISE